MDADRFLRELPLLFADFPRSEHPLDRRLATVVERLDGLTCENNLALLNLAASCLADGEQYVEVGVYRGSSLIGAMLDNDDRSFVGIDSFQLQGGSLAQLEENVASFGVAPPRIVVGDVFELAAAGALDWLRVGVWYYDALHTYEAQLEGLRVAEPYLVPGALLLVDDTDWEQVERSLGDYLAEQPRARRVLSIDGKDRGASQWWEGMQALVWSG
jgi:predicted O-methyltransferase YrrM